MRSNSIIRFRVTTEQKAKLEAKANQFGFGSLSNYLRFISLNADFLTIEQIAKAKQKQSEEK